MADNSNPGESGYSQEYVEKLRKEAADWRTKYRDLESHTASTQISTELAKRGIKAEPSWVQVGEGMSASDAVDNFAAQYPHLSGQQPSTPDQPTQQFTPRLPSVDTPGNQTNTNLPNDPTKGRSLQEIKKDPVARGQLRDRYRQMISQASRQLNPLE